MLKCCVDCNLTAFMSKLFSDRIAELQVKVNKEIFGLCVCEQRKVNYRKMHVNLMCQGGDGETKESKTIQQELEVIVTDCSFITKTHLYLKDFSALLSEESQNLGLIHLYVSLF